MSSKLYKEIGYSLGLGAAIGYSYVHWLKMKYLVAVDETYDKLKHKFATNPILSTMKEDQQILKNFGFNKFSDNDEEDEDDEEENYREPGIFEGNPELEKSEYKARFVDFLYGN